MTTSETHLSSPPSPGQASFSRWHRAGCCGRIQVPATRRKTILGKERETIPFPGSVSGVEKFSTAGAQWTSHVTAAGAGPRAPSRPQIDHGEGSSWDRSGSPPERGAGVGAGDHQWCLVRGHVRLQTSTCLPTARSSPTRLRNSFSSRVGRTRG